MSERVIPVRIRLLRPEDLPAWVALINAADAVDQLGRATSVDEAAAKLRSPGYGYERVLVAWHRRRPIGYADLWRQADDRGIGGVTVHPLFRGRGIGHKLLRRLMGLARREGVRYLDVPVVPRIMAARALLVRAGFKRVRYWWEMIWLGREPPPAPDPPPGVHLRPFRSPKDMEAWIALDARAFAGHWGSGSLTREDIVALLQRPDFDPEGLWFAEIDGKLVGQAIARYNTRGPKVRGIPLGRIDDVAVLPAYRGRGIGRALVLAAMGYLWRRGCRIIELTVDAENVHARRLYEALGFIEVGQLHWYRYALG